MGKSSSATTKKRKRSKNSSQVRKKKRSKTKKSRSKKLRHRDDLVSYSSDDSRSSVSVSVSSSSKDSYRHRRSRSRTHKDVKGSRRRARTHYSSTEESHRLKKRKKLRRNDDSGVRKKTYRSKKKKVAREASTSSRSSGSRNCSTWLSLSGGSGQSDSGRSRGRPERRESNTRKLKNVKSGARRRRYRSRSCSSCSRHDGSSDHWSTEKVIDGNISKRLKSVITFAKEEKEERESDWDKYKEEMVCDHDGYPSSRSNDSTDGGNKKVSTYQISVESEKKSPIEVEKKEDASAFNIKTTKLPNSYRDGDDHCGGSKSTSDGIETNDAMEEKTSKISDGACNVNANDLESILRQKALENLRRFRGGIQTNVKGTVSPKDENDVTLKSLSTMKSEVNQRDSFKDDGIRGAKVDSAHSVQKEENILDRKNGGNDSVSVKNNAHIPNQKAVAVREKVNVNLSSVIMKPRLVTSKQVLSNATSSAMESPASQDSNKAKLVTGVTVGKHNVTPLKGNGDKGKVAIVSGASAKSSSSLASLGVDVGLNKLQDGSQLEQELVSSATPPSSTGNDTTFNNTFGSTSGKPSSDLTSAARDISSSKVQDDDKESSQLEQKTMSVMRGGEMVQVSYKVYIPKKAPALARRQLKR